MVELGKMLSKANKHLVDYYLPNVHNMASVIQLLTAQMGPGPMQVSLPKLHETHQQTK